MDASETNYPPGDPRLIDKIVYQLKSQGIFDQFRKECMADVDTKPAYQNLHQRVEASVSTYLAGIEWKPDLSKNQLRENLRKHINESGFLEIGVERIVDQVVNPKIRTVFLPHVEEVVYSFLGLERPKQARPATNTSLLKPQMNDPPPHAEMKQPEPKKVVTLSDLLPHDLDPVSPESDTCELTLKLEDDIVDVDFSDGETNLKDKKPEEDTSPAFEPLLDENSNGSHISGMSGFSSHEEGEPSPEQQDELSHLSRPEKMEVEVSCKSESESGADKVSSTVEENAVSPERALTHDMGALDIREPASARDEKCDSSMDSVRNDGDKEKGLGRRDRSDGKSSKPRSDGKDRYKSSDKLKHDSKDKKTEKDKFKHEENKSRSKNESKKEKESGSKKEKCSDGRKDKVSEVKKDKKTEGSKSEHRDSGSKKEKDTASRKEKEHESRKEKDIEKKHDKNNDRKKDSDRDKSKYEDRSKSKHDDKSKDRSKGETKHGKEGKDKSQNHKDEKYIKTPEKKGKNSADQKSRDGEKKDSKEKSSLSSTHKQGGDDSEKKNKDKKLKSSDATMPRHAEDKHSADGDSYQKSKEKSKTGRSRTKTPDDWQSTDGESDARSRDSYKKTKDTPVRRQDDQASSDGESDHMGRNSDKRYRKSRHGSDKQRGNDDRSENGDGDSRDDDKKRKERKSRESMQDDHHMHRSRRDHDRRSADRDRDSSGSAPQSGGGQAPRPGRAGHQESSPRNRKNSKTSDTNSSATDAPDNLKHQLLDAPMTENQDAELSPTSSLPFKKRPLLQDADSENVNDNLYSTLFQTDVQEKGGSGMEEVNSMALPKKVEKQKLGEVEKSLHSEMTESLTNNVPHFDVKLNGTFCVKEEDDESDVKYFKSCDDSILDDRDRQYMKALRGFKDKDSDSIFTKCNDDEVTICAVSQCFEEFARIADELGIKVVRTVKDIEVFCDQEEEPQELGNSFKDLLKNRRYVVRLDDDVRGLRESTNQVKTDAPLQLPVDTAYPPNDYAGPDNSPDDQGADRCVSDEDASYDASLSSDLILPSLQDLLRESGMVPATVQSSAQLGACRRVGLPRPATRKSDSACSSGGACLDKKNGMSSDRRLLRSSVGESQRYSSEELYKPRPLFSHGSRRNRHNSDEQASHPVGVATAHHLSRNLNPGALHDSPRLDRIMCRKSNPHQPKVSAVTSPSGCPQPLASSVPYWQNPDVVGPQEAVIGSDTSPAASPHVRHRASSPVSPPLTMFLALPQIQSCLFACRSARTGGTRGAQ